jgi:hypothetical protein
MSIQQLLQLRSWTMYVICLLTNQSLIQHECRNNFVGEYDADDFDTTISPLEQQALLLSDLQVPSIPVCGWIEVCPSPEKGNQDKCEQQPQEQQQKQWTTQFVSLSNGHVSVPCHVVTESGVEDW